MTTQAPSNTEINETHGVLSGPVRKPFNEHLQSESSIHHDATAQKVGMRGGTIAGSYHFEQFVPLFLKAFGEKWFQTGSISLYFKNATTHLEPVQAFMRVPDAGDNTQVDIWMTHENGMMVAEGTASVGNPDQPSALRQRVNNLHPPGEVRILNYLSPGMQIPEKKVSIGADQIRDRYDRITEPLDWYINDSPFGGPILSPAQVNEVMRWAMIQQETQRSSEVVGLFGALEFRFLNGPVFAGKEYINSGKILAVGETPKTEYYWFEGLLTGPDTKIKIAESLILIRIMKISSSLYPEMR